MYVNMAEAGARLDPAAAASMSSQYRPNNGLGAVVVFDPALVKLAEAQSQAMASQNKLDHDVKAPLPKRLNSSGLSGNGGGPKTSRPRVSYPRGGLFRLA